MIYLAIAAVIGSAVLFGLGIVVLFTADPSRDFDGDGYLND